DPYAVVPGVVDVEHVDRGVEDRDALGGGDLHAEGRRREAVAVVRRRGGREAVPGHEEDVAGGVDPVDLVVDRVAEVDLSLGRDRGAGRRWEPRVERDLAGGGRVDHGSARESARDAEDRAGRDRLTPGDARGAR